MKLKYIVLMAGIIISLAACKNAGKKESIGDTEKVYTFNIDKTKEYIDLKLSDLADHFRLIPLETTDESLLGRSKFYVGDQYILAYTDKGVYKFSPEGKFIRKIINVGKGPQEVSEYNPEYFVAENNLLYINDNQHNEDILVYDILNEQFREPVKKCIPGTWSSIAVNEKGNISGTPLNPLKSDSMYYAVIFQNAAGKFVSGILNRKRQKGFMENEELGYQVASILPSRDGLRAFFNCDDTIYAISQDRVKPHLILEFDKPREYPPEAIPQIGERMIFPDADAPGFMIINVMVAEESEDDNQSIGFAANSEGKNQGNVFVGFAPFQLTPNYVFLDKSSGASSIIRTYHDNLIDKTQDVLQIIKDKKEDVKFPKILPNNKLIVSYESLEILDAVEKGITSDGFPQKTLDQLIEISKTLKEEDNPVLLVGELIN